MIAAAIAWQTIIQKRTPESEVEVSYATLKSEVQYRFRVIPMNMVGVGTPSPASETINTPEPGNNMCLVKFAVSCIS